MVNKKIIFFLLLFCLWLTGARALFAFIATSTNFKTIQGIQSVSGGHPIYTYSTSTSFKEFGAGGEAAIGIGTSTSFVNHAGIISSMMKTKDNIEMYLTFVASTESFNSAAPGSIALATSSLGVTTNNATGFTISVSRNDSDTTMDMDTDASINIPDKTNWNPGINCASAGNATASTTEPQTLQFRIRQAGTDSLNYCSAWWGTNDTTNNALFAGFPVTSKPVVYRASSAESQTISIALYNLTIPNTQKTGVYSGIITYTAVANP